MSGTRRLMMLLLLATAVTPALGNENRKLKTIRWMLGDWVSQTEKLTTRESWTESDGLAFRGHGIVTSNDGNQTHGRESLLLAEMDGDVFYLAKPRQNVFPVPFKMISCSSQHAIFENKEHDFPKRLEYRLGKDNELNVTVSDGENRSFVIRFSKSNQP